MKKSDSPQRHETDPENKVSVRDKAAYGVGMMSYSLMVNGYSQMVNPIFNVNLGIGPVMIGWVTALARVWDALTDPFMAHITDNTRSRFGRRRPWVFIGSLVGAFLFALVWWFPEGRSDTFYFWWLLITTFLFYLGFTIFSVPYIALGMEMSPDYHERTRIVAWRSLIGPIGSFVAQSLFWFATLSVFATPIIGMKWTALGVSICIVIFGVIGAIFPREHPSAARAVSKQARVPLLRSARQTLSVGPFRLVCGITVVSLLSVLLVNQLGFYVNLYHVYGGDQPASAGLFALAGLGYQIGAVTAVPIITMTSSRIGKRHTLVVFFCVAIVGSLFKWWAYTPALPYLQIVPNFIMGFGYTAGGMLSNAMLPECADYDELRTGTSRQGMFGAVYSWMFKLGAAVALVGTGYIIKFSGYDAALGAAQSTDTIMWMRLLLAVVPAFGLSLAILLVLRYPITEQIAYDMSRELKARHSEA